MTRAKYKPPHIRELRLHVSCWMWAMKKYLELAYDRLGLEIDWQTVLHHGLLRLAEMLEKEYGIGIDRDSILRLQAECEAESREAV